MNIVVFMRNASKTDYYLFLYSPSVEMIKFYTWRNCILHLEKKSSTLIEILLCTYRNFALHLEKKSFANLLQNTSIKIPLYYQKEHFTFLPQHHEV